MVRRCPLTSGLDGPPRNGWTGQACGETEDGEKHPDDIAEAQRLMAEAGYADGFETTILAANFLSFPDMAQVAANQMESAG